MLPRPVVAARPEGRLPENRRAGDGDAEGPVGDRATRRTGGAPGCRMRRRVPRFRLRRLAGGRPCTASRLVPERRPVDRSRERRPASALNHSSPALSLLSDEERDFQSAVRDFALAEVEPRVAAMDRSGRMEGALVRKLFEMGLMGIEIPEEVGGAGGELLHRRHRRGGALPRRSVGGHPGGRAEHARRQRAAPLGDAGAARGGAAEAGRGHGGRLLALRGRERLGRLRAPLPCDAGRRLLGARRPEDVDHQRRRGRALHRLRHGGARSRLQGDHRVPRGARRSGRRRGPARGEAGDPRILHHRARAGGRARAGRPGCWERWARATASPSRR